MNKRDGAIGVDMEKEDADILVLSFGHLTITNPQLDNLLKHNPGATWEHYSIPVQAREAVVTAIEKTLSKLANRNGVIGG